MAATTVAEPDALDLPATDSNATAARARFGNSYVWIVLGLTLVALLSRIYTTNSLAGEPTSDEYLYAVNARDLARAWAAGHTVVANLGAEGRSVAVESAGLSLVLPWDPLTIGRTVQALLNALCIPMTFVLARQIGLAARRRWPARCCSWPSRSSRNWPGDSGPIARPRCWC